jgi:hypothetical protein
MPTRAEFGAFSGGTDKIDIPGVRSGLNYYKLRTRHPPRHMQAGFNSRNNAKAMYMLCIPNQCSCATGVRKPGGLIARTEHSICSRIVSAVLPMMKPGIPVRATVPIRMQSTARRLARAGISLRALPLDR